MRKLFIVSAFCFAFALNGCATTSEAPGKRAKNSLKNGEVRITYLTPKHQAKHQHGVAFYSKSSHVKHPYRIIGKESISRYDFIGLERQSKTVDDLLKSLAASMGGDAVINITADSQKVEGTVISFEKVML